MSLLILRGLLLAAEALAISAALPFLAWATGLFIRKNAALRHLVWLAALGVLLALPLLALMAPPRMLMLQPAPPVPVDVAMAAPVAAVYAQSWSLELIIALAAAPLCMVWLLGVAWNLLRLALGAHGLMRLRRASTPYDRIANCDVRLGGGPLTFGFIKPVIILPHDAPRWSRERLNAVLRHELAHVRRFDSATQWLAALACAFYWPNPLVWLGAKAMRRDAEMAADDAVLAAGVQPSVYAAELVRLAADARQSSRFAVAMATPSSLEARVTSVLSPTPSRAGVTPMDALKLGLLGGACAVALAFARPDIALAQSAAPAPVTSAPLAAPGATPVAPAEPATEATPQTPSVHKSHHVRNVVVDRRRGPRWRRHPCGGRQGRRARPSVIIHAGMSAEDHEKLRRTLAQGARTDGRHPSADGKGDGTRPMPQRTAQAIRVSAHANAEVWREASQRNPPGRASRRWRKSAPISARRRRYPASGEKIGQKVTEAMAKVQPRIDAAIARANAAARAEVPPPPMPRRLPRRLHLRHNKKAPARAPFSILSPPEIRTSRHAIASAVDLAAACDAARSALPTPALALAGDGLELGLLAASRAVGDGAVGCLAAGVAGGGIEVGAGRAFQAVHGMLQMLVRHHDVGLGRRHAGMGLGRGQLGGQISKGGVAISAAAPARSISFFIGVSLRGL